jgi:hypothetical protein
MKTRSSLRQTGRHATKFAGQGVTDFLRGVERVVEKVPADAAIAYGLIYRHTRPAPSSHWAGKN